jgi:hypothetical protein
MEHQTRKQQRDDAAAKKPNHVDAAKLRAKFDSLIDEIDAVLDDERGGE